MKPSEKLNANKTINFNDSIIRQSIVTNPFCGPKSVYSLGFQLIIDQQIGTTVAERYGRGQSYAKELAPLTRTAEKNDKHAQKRTL